MFYEKKMLILSGDGKGVVMMEKCAGGVRFSLKMFDMPPCGALKAGVITRRDVFVRDLGGSANAFILDIDDIADLHFAVFDDRLRLYGAVGKKMWEANVMDLLVKNDRRSSHKDIVTLSALPPISAPPASLPLPDGTGAPQARLSVYGDEAVAETDFYTRLDMTDRMPVVDRFLDTPRVFDDIAPRIIPPAEVRTEDETDPAAYSTATGEPTDLSSDRSAAQAVAERAIDLETTAAATADSPTEETRAPADESPTEQASVSPDGKKRDGATENDAPEQAAEQSSARESGVPKQTAERVSATENDDATESAAVECRYGEGEQPWEGEARWIKARSGRTLVVTRREVKTEFGAEKAKFLRETAFTERARADIETIFAEGEKDEALNRLLPDIEWVKVQTPEFTLSVGRGGSELLCYAVAGEYSADSPFGADAQWAPSDRTAPDGKGYWLIFQSLATGEIIRE